MQKVLPGVLIGFGALFLLLALLGGWWVFPKVMTNKISQQVQLDPKSITFDKWRNITTPIFIRFHFFNVTNPRAVQEGKSMPRVEEIGPFVYEQKRLKTILDTKGVEDGDTITYTQAITYFYREDLSVGPEDMELTVLNIPLAAIRTRPKPFRNLAQKYFHDNKETLFIQRTVGEMLFHGYIQESVKQISIIETKSPILPDHKFGLYYGKNGTNGTQFEVQRGVRDSSEFGWIHKWNNLEKLPWWGGDSCNAINGTDGSIFAPFVTKDRVLRLFSEELCRSLYLTYSKEVEFRGIPGYRFTLPKRLLARASENEENRCFCENIANQEIPESLQDSESSVQVIDTAFEEDDFFKEEEEEKTPEQLAQEEKKKAEDAAAAEAKRKETARLREEWKDEQCSAGIIHLSACREGRPLAASTPHFLYGEQRDVDNVEGLNPVEELHETFIDLEPMTGLVLQASKKIQVNVALEPIDFYMLKTVPKVLLPILWADEYAGMPEEKAKEFKSKVTRIMSIADIGRWLILALSSLLIISGIVIAVLRARNTKHLV